MRSADEKIRVSVSRLQIFGRFRNISAVVCPFVPLFGFYLSAYPFSCPAAHKKDEIPMPSLYLYLLLHAHLNQLPGIRPHFLCAAQQNKVAFCDTAIASVLS